jgi:hypothetical protein
MATSLCINGTNGKAEYLYVPTAVFQFHCSSSEWCAVPAIMFWSLSLHMVIQYYYMTIVSARTS